MDIVSELNADRHNITALRTILAPSWVSAPNYRGTTSILWSCLVTLIACIYTAIHLNIPPAHTSQLRSSLMKAKWVFTALIAPEIVLCCALHQWRQAQKLVSRLNQLRRETDQGQKQVPQDFDMRYGFFVGMGGLRVSTREICDDCDTMALTTDAVLELARLGRLADVYISSEEIADRSKASLIQKALIVFQVLWMVIQCASRKIYGLPLTLLEIHTMVHVFCALLMYAFWINKPLDISSPQLVVMDEELDSIVAFMLLENRLLSSGEADGIVIYPPYSLETAGNTYAIKNIPEDSRSTASESGPLVNPDTESPGTLVQWVDPSPEDQEAFITLKPGSALRSGFGYALRNPKTHMAELRLSRKQVEKWNRAAAFINKHEGPDFPSKLPQALHPKAHNVRYYAESRFNESLEEISSNFPNTIANLAFTPDDDEFTDVYVFLLAAVCLAFIYGGVHLSAWNFEFPTKTELLLWKISGFGIMAIIPACFLWAWVMVRLDITAYFGFPMYLFLLFYILCRCYLVVESFISLRSVPIGVYWTPSWLQMLPHI